jgi:hypothetical protein
MRRAFTLGGFNSLRTRPPQPMDPALVPEARHCTICGARLSRYNITDSCCCHMGAYDIPEWATALAGSGVSLNLIARLVTGEDPVQHGKPSSKVRARDRAIRAFYASGKWSERELAAAFGISRPMVQEIRRQGEQ